MKKLPYYLLALSLLLNIMLFALLARGIELPAAEAINDIKEPGTYGPPAMEVVDKDFTINTVDVTLQNTLVNGNLFISILGQEGTITLEKVKVQGNVVVSSDRDITIILKNCLMNNITLQDGSGKLTLVAQGTTTVSSVETFTETVLTESELDNAEGFTAVKISTAKPVTLTGDFDSLDITSAARLQITEGKVPFISIQGAAGNSEIDLAQGVEVGKLTAQTVFILTGQGTVFSLELNSAGLSKLQGDLRDVLLQAGGIFLELDGTIANLKVPELEHATSITLAENCRVENMELGARTGITGQGTIGTVTITAQGVEIDQSPEKIIIPQGLTALINGQEYKYEPKPEPKPEPPKPTVSVNSISNMSLLVNGTGTRNITVAPGGAALTVRSSNTTVATVSISGNTVTVTGKKAGTATITVNGSMNGYNSTSRSFTVTVNSPTAVKEFEVRDGLSPGKKLVFVTLYDPDPSKYVGKVRIGTVVLQYLSEQKKFYGEVNTTDAKASNVRVD